MPENGGIEGIGARRLQQRLPVRRGSWRTWGARLPVAVLAGAASVALTVTLPTRAYGDVNSDQTQISQLQQRISQDGQNVQNFVSSYDQAIAKQQQTAQQVSEAQARLAADQQAQDHAMAVLRKIALSTYMTDSEDNAALAIFDTGSGASQLVEQEYSRVANADLRQAVDAVEADARQTQSSEAQLRASQAQAAATVTQLTGARQAAQNALDQDNAVLSQVKGNLAQLLAQQAEERAQQEQQAEEAMAAQQAAQQAAANAASEASAAAAAAAVRPPVITLNPSPGTYANPLRSIAALNPERVDQGVDYSGFGSIYAIGDGKVLSIANSGWPGGTFIAYRLTDGPAAGLVVYAAEDIEPMVTIGQKVDVNTVVGIMYEGPDGIETGWADPSGDGVSMARDYGQFSGANSTAFGANFSQMLASIGAPPGIMQNEPPTGSLPPNWPSW